MDLVLPDEESENKFRYNKKELKWCEENEKYMWQYIIDHELLYEKDYNKFNYFLIPDLIQKILELNLLRTLEFG